MYRPMDEGIFLPLLTLLRQIDPIPLFYFSIDFNLVFQDAAITRDGLSRTDVILITNHQNSIDAEFLAFLQTEPDDLGRVSFLSLARSYPISDMPAIVEQSFIKPMTDVDRPNKNVSFHV